MIQARTLTRRTPALLITATVAAAWLLAGPLAFRAHALPPTPESDFRDAIAGTTCDGTPDTILISGAFAFASSGDPVYTCNDDLTIQSTPGTHWTIDGTGVLDTRFLDASASTGTITILDLTIEGFEATAVGDGSTAGGGALVSGGDVVIDASTFSTNSVRALGNSTEIRGGAVAGAGLVTITDSIFSDNSLNTLGGSPSVAMGGAVHAMTDVEATASNFSDNLVFASGAGSDVRGGAICAGDSATIEDSTFTSNSAEGEGSATGGAVMAMGSGADVINSAFTTNFAASSTDAYGGALAATGYTEVELSTFTDNYVNADSGAGDGGALWSDDQLWIFESTLTGNSTTSQTGGTAGGGGAYAINTLWVIFSTVTNNQAIAAATGPDAATAAGGGVATDGAAVLVYSTFEDNLASGSADVNGSGFGGAAHATGLLWTYTSTFTANTAQGFGSSGAGGGGAVASPAVTSTSSTLVANVASDGSQVLANDLSLYGTVLADASPSSANCTVDGTITSSGYNFDDDESCVTTGGTDFGASMDPMLDALADNQGPTKTMAPLAGSPLIDVVTDANCITPPNMLLPVGDVVDQRGVPRVDGACDIGAVELIAPVTFSVVTPGGTINGTAYEAMSVDNIVWTAASAASPAPPAGLSLPFGIFGFEATVPDLSGFSTTGWTVTIELETPTPVNSLWKLHLGSWGQVTGATIVGTTITYSLTDGGTNDEDVTINGVIVDPVGAGNFASFTG